jgi:Spy/CpxP family protein refolding chaperone
MQDLREQLRTAHQALREYMESEDYSASKVRDQFEKSEKFRAEMAQEKFSFKLQQREVLGQERFLTLKEIGRRVAERRQGDHHHRRCF